MLVKLVQGVSGGPCCKTESLIEGAVKPWVVWFEQDKDSRQDNGILFCYFHWHFPCIRCSFHMFCNWTQYTNLIYLILYL